MARSRLDERVVAEGLAPDLRQARGLIMRGDVLVADRPETKPGAQVRADAIVRVKGGAPPRFVSRGGDKLRSALDQTGARIGGKRCLDIGSATGGFVDCLLQAGASGVCAVDVGYGLLADVLRRDPRVVVMERTNARHLTREALPWPIDLITVDASFIGLDSLVGPLTALVDPGAELLAMVKPQFELPRAQVPRGGVVLDDDLRWQAAAGVQRAAETFGWKALASCDSALAGPKGNREIFVWLRLEAGDAHRP